MAFLSALRLLLGSNGQRLDQPAADGTFGPVDVQLGPGLTGSYIPNGASGIVQLGVGGGPLAGTSLTLGGGVFTEGPLPTQQFTFNDTSPHPVLSLTVPLGSSATVETSVHGHLISPIGLVAVVDFRTIWGFANTALGMLANFDIAGDLGWGTGNNSAIGAFATSIAGNVISWQITNGALPPWGTGAIVPGAVVTDGGKSYITPNGGTATTGNNPSTLTYTGTPPTGTGTDGIHWIQVSSGTDSSMSRTWRVTVDNVELASL